MSSLCGLILRHKLLMDRLEGGEEWEGGQGYRGSCLGWHLTKGWPVIHYDLGQKHDPDQLDSFLRNLELGSRGAELHEQWGWSLKG